MNKYMSEETQVVPEQTTETTPADQTAEIATETVQKTKLINFDELKAGQTIRLHERIKDISAKGEERQRIQVFEGIILGVRGSGVSKTMTIRKVSGGIGVEKIYPINSPVIDKIELVKTARVRRAKLNFISNIKKHFKRRFKETYITE